MNIVGNSIPKIKIKQVIVYLECAGGTELYPVAGVEFCLQ